MTPYITVADATTYFGERLNTDAWDDATEANKLKALKQSTRAIDRLNFRGTKTEGTQELEFPRYDETGIPDDVQYACAENALALLDGIDPIAEREDIAVTVHGIGSARTSMDRSFVPEYIQAGIASPIAWDFLRPYLRDPREIDIIRS